LVCLHFLIVIIAVADGDAGPAEVNWCLQSVVSGDCPAQGRWPTRADGHQTEAKQSAAQAQILFIRPHARERKNNFMGSAGAHEHQCIRPLQIPAQCMSYRMKIHDRADPKISGRNPFLAGGDPIPLDVKGIVFRPVGTPCPPPSVRPAQTLKSFSALRP